MKLNKIKNTEIAGAACEKRNNRKEREECGEYNERDERNERVKTAFAETAMRGQAIQESERKAEREKIGRFGKKGGRERMPKRTLVAITGGIGSGKSTAANALKEAGYPVISCDKVCAELYKLPSFRRKLKKYFPTAVKGFLFPKIDKAELAERAFMDDDGYEILTERVTEPVYKKALQKARRRRGLIFIEVPLLFEHNKQGDFDKVIIVLRNRDDREESVFKRSGLKKSQIAARIARQVDYGTLDLTPYRVLRNDGTAEELQERVKKLAKALELEFEHGK